MWRVLLPTTALLFGGGYLLKLAAIDYAGHGTMAMLLLIAGTACVIAANAITFHNR